MLCYETKWKMSSDTKCMLCSTSSSLLRMVLLNIKKCKELWDICCCKHIIVAPAGISPRNPKILRRPGWLSWEGAGLPRGRSRVQIPPGPSLRVFKSLRRKCCLCNDIRKWLDFLVFSDKDEKPWSRSQHFPFFVIVRRKRTHITIRKD